ncbi:MAG: hypothetical protein XD54_1615 [Thermococcus sibiricus]|uniref:Uncharacterized protein n=1 Tax=Thermococcus sibiricus TaxID=172049 RepID=A0A101EKY6_9EURY|nr:MAG: hypothetical protein XD54_1615 [Thermococcus sibiricus]
MMVKTKLESFLVLRFPFFINSKVAITSVLFGPKTITSKRLEMTLILKFSTLTPVHSQTLQKVKPQLKLSLDKGPG